MHVDRRQWMAAVTAAGGVLASPAAPVAAADDSPGAAGKRPRELKITGLRATPIALPDPPLLAASGCHGPYFLRTIVEVTTDAGIVGIGETYGGQGTIDALQKCAKDIAGQSAFAYRRFAAPSWKLGAAAYAGVELACLDAIGRATGRRLCELLGGPVRDRVELAAYLFFRYAADHPKLLDDPRIVDGRGRGEKALDGWGEVRTPDAMAELAGKFHDKYGFRVHKLKGGVLPPDVELEALRAINARFQGKHALRIDPNGRWQVATAVRIGEKLRELPMEYYEDPVTGQEAMAEVRRKTGLKMSTNMCVTQFGHIPPAIRLAATQTSPIDVVLADHHYWGGIPACQALGTMAATLGWSVSQHSNNHAGVTMAAMVHLAAVVPQMTVAGDTHYPWLPDAADIIEGPKLRIVDGQMAVPDGPGLGVTLDGDKLARAHEVYRRSGMKDRDDAATMRRVEPGWKRTLF